MFNKIRRSRVASRDTQALLTDILTSFENSAITRSSLPRGYHTRVARAVLSRSSRSGEPQLLSRNRASASIAKSFHSNGARSNNPRVIDQALYHSSTSPFSTIAKSPSSASNPTVYPLFTPPATPPVSDSPSNPTVFTKQTMKPQNTVLFTPEAEKKPMYQESLRPSETGAASPLSQLEQNMFTRQINNHVILALSRTKQYNAIDESLVQSISKDVVLKFIARSNSQLHHINQSELADECLMRYKQQSTIAMNDPLHLQPTPTTATTATMSTSTPATTSTSASTSTSTSTSAFTSASTDEVLRMEEAPREELSDFEIDVQDKKRRALRVLSYLDCAPSERALLEEQIDLENRCVLHAHERFLEISENLKDIGKGMNTVSKKSEKILAEWFVDLRAAIQDEFETLEAQDKERERAKKSRRRSNKAAASVPKQSKTLSKYHQQLSSYGLDALTTLVLHETTNRLLVAGDRITFTQLCFAIGKTVEDELKIQALAKDKKRWRELMADKRLGSKKNPNLGIVMAHCNRIEDPATVEKWGQKEQLIVGSELLRMLLDNTTVRTKDKKLEPAFKHSIVQEVNYGNVRHQGIIECHPSLMDTFGKDSSMGKLAPRFMPMLTKPRPWTDYNKGGYLSYSHKVMRTRGSHLQTELLRVSRENIGSVYEGLNYLGSIPWAVNNRVREVLNKVWDDGGGVCDLPSLDNLPMPMTPTATKEEDPQAHRDYAKQVRKVKQLNADLYSLRCSTNYKLDLANELHDRVFHFPMNLDFRGRVYPIPPHLNHIGDDLCRGLLTFAEGRPLGTQGLKWLKIQLANLYGKDKLSFTNRQKWVDDNIDHIMAVHDDPLCLHMHKDKPVFWYDAEEPWQFLAACFEFTAAYRSPNVEEYVSYMPVHQDGSCNGLQHYAAIGRDTAGGAAVNLTPPPVDDDRPQDVYSGVCDLVNEDLHEEARKGNAMAELLKGKITRKIVKQTVMTSVYGVTAIGARRQIHNRLEEVTNIDWPEPREKAIMEAATLLSRMTMHSLTNLFTGARGIMNWLSTCASTIARAGQPVCWISPMGLPIVQPYRREKKVGLSTTVQHLSFIAENDNQPVHLARQKAAFPPNFVHSLDASHMLMTALDCRDKGLTFTAVHDSYWTHAGDMDRLSESLREQFIKLYSKPILEDLKLHLELTYPELDFPVLPKTGDLDLGDVKKAPYFFN